MNIYLIGMPGCGKSTVGMKLKNIMNYKYIDLDEYIEEKASMSIPDMFSLYGEEYFRNIEAESLKEIANKDNTIISCGGGIIVNSKNKELMNGKIVFIDSSIEELKSHIENDKLNVRPMFRKKTIEELYNERIDKYLSFMDYKVINKDPQECALKIKELIGDNMRKILVINGPNLNMLGKRNKDHYGTMTLDDINNLIKEQGCFEYEFYQSNHEGDLIDKIQEFSGDGIVINAGAYTHTSVALHDCLEILNIPKIEVHLSDVDNRDDFRKINFLRDVCTHTISGLKENSYVEAINYLKKYYNML